MNTNKCFHLLLTVLIYLLISSSTNICIVFTLYFSCSRGSIFSLLGTFSRPKIVRNPCPSRKLSRHRCLVPVPHVPVRGALLSVDVYQPVPVQHHVQQIPKRFQGKYNHHTPSILFLKPITHIALIIPSNISTDPNQAGSKYPYRSIKKFRKG